VTNQRTSGADRIAGSAYRIVGSRGRLRIVHGSSIIIIA
jgi:hypothetical protein